MTGAPGPSGGVFFWGMSDSRDGCAGAGRGTSCAFKAWTRGPPLHPLALRFFARLNLERPEESRIAAWLFHSDPEAFRARQDEAQAEQDNVRLAACLKVAHQHGALKPKRARKYWTRLLVLHRYAEALEIMQDPRHVEHEPGYRLGLAQALAGTGRLVEALAMARGVGSGDAEFAIAESLAARLERVIEVEAHPPVLADWPTAACIIDDYFELGFLSRAAPWLLAAARSDLEKDAESELLHRAEALLACGEPGLVLGVLLALRPLAARRGAQTLVDVTARMLMDGADGGAPMPQTGPHGEDIEVCCGLALASAGLWTAAIPVLGRVAVRVGAADRARVPLAEAVGQQIIEQVRPSFRPSARRKIVDVFPFFDEFMLLQLKLEEMADWVDHFVVLEATQTFTGKPKPLRFQERRDAFARFADKIVYVPVDFPAHVDTPWAREFYQRDAALPTLAELCGEDDLVLVTDVDEILRREAIEGFQKQFAIFEMPTYAYYFNLLLAEEARFVRGAIWRAKYLQHIGLSTARLELLGRSSKQRLPEAGWHFSSIREAADLPTKFQSYSHTQFSHRTAAYFEALLARIRAGEEPGLHRCDLDSRFPRALLDGRESLKAFLL